jgi:putative redox protein
MQEIQSRGNHLTEGWTEITAAWKNGMTFVGQNATGGTVQMGLLDGKPGISPMQLLLTAVAGCTGEDIISILKKKRLQLSDMQVKVRGKRASEYPMIWTEIHITYLIWGEAIPAKDVEQAIRLSEEKYCSVGLMLGKAAKITSEYRILKPGEKAEIKE